MFSQKWNRFSVHKKIFMSAALLAAYFAPLMLWGQGIATAQNTETSKQPSQEEYSEKVKTLVEFLEGRSSSFVYNRLGRPDPFVPFLKEKIVTSEVEGPPQKLVGMQKFEPGQLSLVAIVKSEDGPLAMVQDSLGRGYMIKQGTEIGRTGIVDKIDKNTVVIKQWYKTSAGEKRYKVVEMLLKKEGEIQ